MKEIKIVFRKLIGWILLGWSFKVMPKGSSEKIALAATIKFLVQNEYPKL